MDYRLRSATLWSQEKPMARGSIDETPRMASPEDDVVVASNCADRCVVVLTHATEPLSGPI